MLVSVMTATTLSEYRNGASTQLKSFEGVCGTRRLSYCLRIFLQICSPLTYRNTFLLSRIREQASTVSAWQLAEQEVRYARERTGKGAEPFTISDPGRAPIYCSPQSVPYTRVTHRVNTVELAAVRLSPT